MVCFFNEIWFKVYLLFEFFYVDKNPFDVVFISKALSKNPNIVYQIADQIHEIVFFPARDNVEIDLSL